MEIDRKSLVFSNQNYILLVYQGGCEGNKMTKIKLCGLSRPEDITAVNEISPDYIGFVFAKSRRQVNEETAKILKKSLNPNIQAVGVFVNEEIKTISRLCQNNIIDIVQLHGDEDENYIRKLRREIPGLMIKAVRVKDVEDIKRAGEYSCDYLLFDTFIEKEYGGSGVAFNWSMIGEEIAKPYFLAGGLHIGNVEGAIKQCHPYCLDVSSGVETDGYKDKHKIREIVAKIRSVE